MKKRTVIWLLVAFVVLVGAYVVLTNWTAIHEHFFPTEYGPYQGDGSVMLYSLDSVEDVSRIDWTIDGTEYSLVRGENDEFECDREIALDQSKIKSELLNNIYTLKASHDLGEANLAEYGLDEPWMHYTIYGPTEDLKVGEEPVQYTVSFGTHNTVTDTYYVTLNGGKTVYLLFGKTTTHFGPYAMYEVSETAPENAALYYVSLQRDGETYEYYGSSNEDGTFYSPVLSWYTVLEDGYKQPVNVDSIDALYKVYSDLAWSGIAESDPASLEPYGLDDPQRLELRYSYQAQNGEEYEERLGSFVFLLGGYRDNHTCYAMLEGSDTVHYISTELIEGLLDFDPEAMPYHVAVVPEWQTMRKMEITLADGATCVCEIRVDADGKSTYFIEGTEVEKEDVRSVFVSLFNPAVDGLISGEPKPVSEAAVKVHFVRDRKTFSDMTLYLIPYNSTLYAVDFADEQRYLISARVVDGITVAVQEALEKVK